MTADQPAFAPSDVASLGAKLRMFADSLTDAERAALEAGLARLLPDEDGGGDVQGYGLGVSMLVWRFEAFVRKDVDGDGRVGAPPIREA